MPASTIQTHSVKMLYLPRTMDNWPCPCKINPHYKEISSQSNAWFHSFRAFSTRSQRVFDKCDFEHLRTGCDLMNLFFVIDKYTDMEPAPVVCKMVDIVIDTLKNPEKPCPEAEVILGQITKEFWQLALKTAMPSAAKHFVETFTDSLELVVTQAADRDNDKIETMDEYLKNRCENIGAQPSYVPGELHLDLPDEAFYHPIIKELEYLIAELVLLDNDLASHNKEQAAGDDRHNIVTIAMHQFHTNYEGAIEWICRYHTEVESKFIAGMKCVPSFGAEVDKQLKEYIKHLANFPRGNDCWNFESGRYFGSEGLEIQKTRFVALLEQVKQDPAAKKDQVVVPSVVDALY
ncbi:terpenoid synthase [Fistulina hepatica ATCC 64428]|uniref:Terpene synthase n=1 Tax=Fistulina hepatica ATCC 64428 TaxID=1128425 RepID=A0A0D7ALT3_9AGAR|nr:terpenoid synthase [Fistulina hepatica ATCC 64428]